MQVEAKGKDMDQGERVFFRFQYEISKCGSFGLETMVRKQFMTYNKSLVSLATHSQPRLNSFQTVKTLFCIALSGHLDFISFLGCALFLAGNWPQSYINR